MRTPYYSKDIKNFMFKVPFFQVKKLLRLIGFYRKESLYYFNFDGITSGDILLLGSGWKNSVPYIYFPDQWDLHYDYKVDINPYYELVKYCDNKGWLIINESKDCGNGLWFTFTTVIETTQSKRMNILDNIGI